MKRTEYQVGKLHFKGAFRGWAVWRVHVNCKCLKCPITMAQFFGEGAKRNAIEFCECMRDKARDLAA